MRGASESSHITGFTKSLGGLRCSAKTQYRGVQIIYKHAHFSLSPTYMGIFMKPS